MRVRRKVRRRVQRRTPSVRRGATTGVLVGGARDPAEARADHLAAQVFAGRGVAPAAPATPPAVRRACCDGCAAGGSCEEDAPATDRAPTTRRQAAAPTLAPGTAAAHAGPGATNAVSRLGTGRPLAGPARAFFEPRFGRDLSGVRVHTGAKAARATRALDAAAFAHGRDIAFGPGALTRRTLAHELAHVVMDAAPGPVRRLVSCEGTEACPSRSSGEAAWSRGRGLAAREVTSPDPGFLVSNFEIDGADASALSASPTWAAFDTSLAASTATWQVRGFSDCQGGAAVNGPLRRQRADVALSMLSPAARTRVAVSQGAPLDQCIASNADREGRAKNRAAFFEQISSPVPEPAPQPEPPESARDVYLCSKPLDTAPTGSHAFFRLGGSDAGNDTVSLQPSDLVHPSRGSSCIEGLPGRNYRWDRDATGTCIRSTVSEACLDREYASYPVGKYCTLGPNSNSFVGHIARTCGDRRTPPTSRTGGVPGYGDGPPRAGTYAPNRYVTLLGCSQISCRTNDGGQLEPYLPETYEPRTLPDGSYMDRRGIVWPGMGPKW